MIFIGANDGQAIKFIREGKTGFSPFLKHHHTIFLIHQNFGTYPNYKVEIYGYAF